MSSFSFCNDTWIYHFDFISFVESWSGVKMYAGGPFVGHIVFEFARNRRWSLTPNVSTQLFRRSNIAWTRRQVGKSWLDIWYELILWRWAPQIQEDDHGTCKRFGDAWKFVEWSLILEESRNEYWSFLPWNLTFCCHIFALYLLKRIFCSTKIPKLDGTDDYQGCKSVVLCSHLGRPDGSAVEKSPKGKGTRKKQLLVAGDNQKV